MKIFLFFSFLILLACSTGNAPRTDLAVAPNSVLRSISNVDDLSNLNSGHPRLCALEGEWDRMRETLNDPDSAKYSEFKPYYASPKNFVESTMTPCFDAKGVPTADEAGNIPDCKDGEPHLFTSGKPSYVYQLVYQHPTTGSETLSKAMAMLSRIPALAATFLLEVNPEDSFKVQRYNPKFLEARLYLLQLSGGGFPDWNTEHFLDTGIFTQAVAIGYDWLYRYLTEPERALIRSGIFRKGMQPGLVAFKKGKWATDLNNWTVVTPGGISVGALAIANDNPDPYAPEIMSTARALLADTDQVVGQMMKLYAADGGWPESPGYADGAATRDLIAFLAAYETAMGHPSRLTGLPGFGDTGNYTIAVHGPLLKPNQDNFNYGDDPGLPEFHGMFWLSKKFKRKEYAEYEKQRLARNLELVTPFHIIWFEKTPPEFDDIKSLPLDRQFRGAYLATFRSQWFDLNGLFLGVKGAVPKVGHAHADAGSFVLDQNGIRWALDLGSDDYTLQGYFDSACQRWRYYPLSAEGHNNWSIPNKKAASDQDWTQESKLAGFSSSLDQSKVVVDLSSTYRASLASVQRGFRVIRKQALLLQDEILPRSSTPIDLQWNFHTQAVFTVDGISTPCSRLQGDHVSLMQGGKRLNLKILAPPGAQFECLSDANPLLATPCQGFSPTHQGEQPGVNDMVIRFKQVRTPLTVKVSIAPDGVSSQFPDAPLTNWLEE